MGPFTLQDPTLLRDRQFVAGRWQPAADGRRLAVVNPSTGECVAEVPDSSAADATAAVDAAHGAFAAWAARTAKDRAAVLRRWHALIVENVADLGRLLATEQGKPLDEACGEVAFGASYVEWYAEEGKRVYGETIPSTAASRRLAVIRQPVGVAAMITPWNFPSAMVARKVAPALSVGCTVVLKPAETTPLSALALAALAERAGLPPGVFNVVTTAAPQPVGAAFTDDERVRKVSFTGSTRVGAQLMRQCAAGIKKVSLELGGNAPFIVFDDADLDAALDGLMTCKFRNAGQTCISANRVYVHERVFDRFAERLAAAVAALRVGDAFEPGVQLGPLINRAALDKVGRLVVDALGRGARAVIGGRPHARGGLFYAPTVLVDVPPDARLGAEEIFGPVAALARFADEAEAVARANDTPHGLAAYFYSRDVARCWRVAEALQAGIVGINEGFISTEVAPFGGVKASGIGREGSHHGIDDYLELKYLCFGGVHPA